ncbi:protein spire homolog 2 isoform X2 [Paroedura picta]|uniref:protein spire homolog 2 isoform X2 n=1 Tax=Paroedura picta TaxID=143630 RepID=UPI004057B123
MDSIVGCPAAALLWDPAGGSGGADDGAAAMARAEAAEAAAAAGAAARPSRGAEERAGGGCGCGGGEEAGELSLGEVLKAYEQPVNEEQAWAVCFQCCRGLRGSEPGWGPSGRIRHPDDILLRRDGTVWARGEHGAKELPLTLTPSAEAQMVQSLGFAIYRALDWGLDENEERELSPQLEHLIDLMANSDSEDSGCGTADEGYEGQEEEEEAVEGAPLRAVRTFSQAMRLCAARLTHPQEAQAHYQAVCRALFLETVELKAFLAKIRNAKEMLTKLKEEEDEQKEQSAADLDNLKNTDWARLWVQLMRELRHGVKLKKVQEKQFNPLPTEYQLTPFEMLMQDIRARNYKLRKVMVDGDIPPRVKKNAHELILDFIRSRPPLRQASERQLRPVPQKQQTLHEQILQEIRQERKLRPVQAQKGFGSLPCLLTACPRNIQSSSCINLSAADPSGAPPRQRPRVLLKAPTLAEMEEMNISEEEDSPSTEAMGEPGPLTPLKRDRSFSEQDLALLRSGGSPTPQPGMGGLGGSRSEPRPRSGSVPASYQQGPSGGSSASPSSQGVLSAVEESAEADCGPTPEVNTKHLWLQEFSHPVESLALTVEEMINVRRVLVKAEMEKFLHSKELYSSLKKGKICCCCRTKFALFSWPPVCLFCKRSVCSSCSLKIKMPSKKLAHIPVFALGFETLPGSLGTKGAPPYRRREAFRSLQGTCWRSVEEEFPIIYAHGSMLKDVCNDCSGFVTDVVSSSRKSMDILNRTPGRSRKTQSLYIPSS